MTIEEELARMREENARLKAENEKRAQQPEGLRMKVGEKGGASLYGLQRWPITLYKEQWRKLLEYAPEIEGFLVLNDAKLKTKEVKE